MPGGNPIDLQIILQWLPQFIEKKNEKPESKREQGMNWP